MIKYYNRHGMITGTTGTGKTTTVLALIKELQDKDIPVFAVDIKGDMQQQLKGNMDVLWEPRDGMMSLNNIDPIILSKMLNLNDTQTSVLITIFKEIDGLYSLDDLQAALDVYSHPERYNIPHEISNLPKSSLEVIRRNIAFVEEAGYVFSNSAPNIPLEGTVILDATELQHHPEVYATLMIAMINNMYKNSLEVGDENRGVIIIDEAHLLFKNMTPRLRELFENNMRLIRSKGIGVWLATQAPTDIPEVVQSQIGTRIMHGMRVFTRKDALNVRASVEGLRGDYKSLYEQIQNLGTGEVLFSTLDEEGIPTIASHQRVVKPEWEEVFKEEKEKEETWEEPIKKSKSALKETMKENSITRKLFGRLL